MNIQPVSEIHALRQRAVIDGVRRAQSMMNEALDTLVATIEDAFRAEMFAAHAETSTAEVGIDARAVAAKIHKSVSHVRELARSGRIPHHAIPGAGSRNQLLFYRSEIEAWIAERARGSERRSA